MAQSRIGTFLAGLFLLNFVTLALSAAPFEEESLPPLDRFEDVSFPGDLPIVALAAAPSDSQRVYAVSSDGYLLHSRDGGRSFRANSRVLRPGIRPAKIWVHPFDADDLLVDVAEGYRSRDGGLTITPLRLANVERVRGLWLDPRRPEQPFSSRWNQLLIYEEGQGWRALPVFAPFHDSLFIADLAFDPRIPRRMLAAVSESFGNPAAGIYESLDDGRTWIQRLSGPSATRVMFDPADPSQVWAFTFSGEGALWHSHDGGVSWARTAAPVGSELTHLSVDPSRRYVLVISRPRFTTQETLIVSRDGGDSWEQVGAAPIADGDAAIVALNDGRWLLGSGNSPHFFESSDAGATWRGHRAMPGPALSVVLDPHDPDHAWTIDSSRLFRTTNGGRSWQPVFSAPDEYLTDARLVVDPGDNRILYLAHSRPTPGPCVWRSVDRGRSWQEAIRSPGDASLVDLVAGRRGQQSFVLVSFYGRLAPAALWRSGDQGESWVARPLENLGPMAVDPDHGAVYQVANNRLWQSLDGGLSFAPLQDFEPLDLRALGLEAGPGNLLYLLARSDSGLTEPQLFSFHPGQSLAERPVPSIGEPASDMRIWTGARTGQLFISERPCCAGLSSFWRSDDAGRSWITVNSGLPEGGIRDLAPARDGVSLWVLPHTYGVFRGRISVEEDPPLTLQQGRFEITATWKDFLGQTGQGHGRFLTDRIGYFWFFSPDNIELAVRVLDGRSLFGTWWVFYASLSNVEFDLEVKDTLSGEVRRYHNPAGQFASLGDTQAFPDPLPPNPLTKAISSPSAALLHERFEITLDWRDFNGNSGTGSSRRYSEDTVTFSFRADSIDNVEMIVKILDGRALNGHFWIFYGSLTNVEYTLTIRDNWTGLERRYFNPLGTFASHGDIYGIPDP